MLPLSWLRKFWELRAVFGVSTKWQPSFAFDKPGSLKFCGGVLLEIQSGIQIILLKIHNAQRHCSKMFEDIRLSVANSFARSLFLPLYFFFFSLFVGWFVLFQSISFHFSLFRSVLVYFILWRHLFVFGGFPLDSSFVWSFSSINGKFEYSAQIPKHINWVRASSAPLNFYFIQKKLDG